MIILTDNSLCIRYALSRISPDCKKGLQSYKTQYRQDSLKNTSISIVIVCTPMQSGLGLLTQHPKSLTLTFQLQLTLTLLYIKDMSSAFDEVSI